MHNNTKHIVRLAQQQALASFAELVAGMLAETDGLVASALRTAPPSEHAALTATRHWLNEHGRAFRAKIQAKFSGSLERAMETMHTDLRAGLRDIRAANLSLVDNDVMTRQVELDRLVLRLRDVDQLSLGRINLTIANLHGVSKVSERENPFRPYLAARALYETVREMATDGAVAKILFDFMAGAMAHQLPAYYGAILAHFEARGLNARLLAQPSEMTRAQRERMNGQLMGAPGNQVQALQELVWQVLDERGPRDAAGDAPTAPREHQALSFMDAQLKQLQQQCADEAPGQTPAPLALSEQLAEHADDQARLTIDLVGLVFDYIVREPLMAPHARDQLARLHVPFLRAAMIDPLLLHTPAHPARALLDRIATVACGMLAHTAARAEIGAEIGRQVDYVLRSFDQNSAVFAHAARELDLFVSSALRAHDGGHTALLEAIGQAESSSALSAAVSKTLDAMLKPLRPDPRIDAFIRTVWLKVILRQGARGADAGLLPELIWSAQGKATPADRALLVRALPDLVRRIREGVALLELPAAEAKAALDQLVAVHMDVLGQRTAANAPSMSLDWLRVHFAQLSVDSLPAAGVQVSDAALQAALAERGLRALLHTEPAQRESMPVDGEWLARARPGAGFEALVDGRFVPVRLAAVNADQSALVFDAPAPLPALVYRKNALLAALDAGTLRALEYAPLFERAVGSVMTGLGPQAAA